MKRWTQEEHDILEQNSHRTIEELCELLPNRTRHGIRQRCEGLGVKNDLWKCRITADKNKLKLLKDNIHLPIQELEVLVGMSASTIRNMIKKHNLREMHITEKWNVDDIKFLENNYGKTDIKEICNKLNRSYYGIVKKASQLKLDSYHLDKELANDITKDEFEELYVSQNKSIEHIAEMYDISTYRIYCLADKYKIKIKTVREATGLNGVRKRGSGAYNWSGCGEISGRYWSGLKGGARSRNIDFSVTIEDAWDLFIKQDKKCFFTGIELVFASFYKDLANQTASLDRIDSLKGYTIDNVQWVHKHVNTMKMNLEQEYFINLCKLISEKFKQEPL